MKTLIQFFITALLFSCSTLVKAQEDSPLEPTFYFPEDTQSPTSEFVTHWEDEYAYGYNDFHNPNHLVTLHSYSAVSETFYNKQLANSRARAIKNFLVQKGVQESNIRYIAYGETIMAGEENTYFAKSELYRSVVVTFERLKPKAPADPINQYKSKKHLQADIKEGEKIFNKIVEVEMMEIKKTYQMVRKVFLQNPSADQEELKNQVKGILIDMKDVAESENPPKEALKFAAKIGLDAFVDLFTSNGSKQVNLARQLKYDVIIEAMTVECFPTYAANISGYSFDDKLLYFSLQKKLSGLSNSDKYMLRAMVIAGPTFTMDTFYTAEKRFNDHMQDPSMFKRNLKNRFQKSKYRFRD